MLLSAGKYELMAVLTHKGRSADSGHYVAWVKQDDKQWIQFDDDELIPRKQVNSEVLWSRLLSSASELRPPHVSMSWPTVRFARAWMLYRFSKGTSISCSACRLHR